MGNPLPVVVPRDEESNRAYRIKVLRECLDNRFARSREMARCKEDCLYWINTYVVQFNPNALGDTASSKTVGPFITWDYQEEAVREILGAMEGRRDLVIEKSREMGASWLCLLVMDWGLLFRPWRKFLMISRNADTVDKRGDPDCLFWKLDFVHEHLPSWMTEGLVRRKMTFVNKRNGSSITGQATTGKAGVGGRAWAMFIDEFSRIDEDFEVLQGTSDTTGCRIFNGTHFGIGTAFHDLTGRAGWKKLVMHWSQHPDKRKGLYRYNGKSNQIEVLDKDYVYPSDFQFVMSETPAGGPYPGLRSPWYDEQCKRKPSQRAVAMDLDIDPCGSVSQVFNPVLIRVLQTTYCVRAVWEGDVEYDRETGKPVGLTSREGGPLKLWLTPKPDGSLPTGRYGAGADLSTGIGNTNSCLSVFNARTGEKVLEYATPHVPPEKLAPLYAAACRMLRDEYNSPALFAWEKCGPGLLFGKTMVKLGYENAYYREGGGHKFSKAAATEPGWYPTPDEKRILLEEYRAALESRQVVNYSEAALQECLPYRYNAQGSPEHPSDVKNEDPTGARVNHGDRVIADGLAYKMIKQLGLRSPQEPSDARTVILGSLEWRRQLAQANQVAEVSRY